MTNALFEFAARLEGEATAAPSILDGLNAEVLMGNWYRIVLIAVAAGCIAGLIYSNIKKNK